ncbi:MAG: Type secretory pathway component PulK-like protein [Rhizorhabdus sp.]|nr:Type secretory pathway component PulK-like protein [Rhizorhabdus sp.]
MKKDAPDEQGMILVNVLLFVAIASGILLLMISAEDNGLERSLRMRDAARAQAIARGGEMSAIVALRRDAIVAPDNDNRGEPWASLSEAAAPIEGGTFDLAITDAQSAFNINALITGDAAAVEMLGRIAASAGIPEQDVPRAVALVRSMGPVSDLRPLRMSGLAPEQIARLSGLITALPYMGKINLNAAGEPLLALLIGDPVKTTRLVALRNRQRYLTAADLASLDIAVPPGTGFTSNLFWVRTRVRIGSASRQITSLIARRDGPAGEKSVAVVGRWVGGSAPSQAPALR